MSNLTTILGNKIGKNTSLSASDVTRLNIQFQMLLTAFQAIQLPGQEICDRDEVVCNNNEIVYL